MNHIGFFTNLNPSNYIRSNYQSHRLHKIKITNFFPINFKNMFAKGIVCIYREKKNIA